MPPVNEANLPNGDHDAGGSSHDNEMRKFTFPSHQFHMVQLAKMCQENKDYTDCVIRVGEDELRAHRLVLSSVSPFLKLVFSDLPANHSEATILVPGVRKRVVKALLDFFYTGQMTVERQDTSDLQLLIDTLQIDPGLITVDTVAKAKPETSQDKATSSESRKRRASSECKDEDEDQPTKAKKINVEQPDDDEEEASK